MHISIGYGISRYYCNIFRVNKDWMWIPLLHVSSLFVINVFQISNQPSASVSIFLPCTTKLTFLNHFLFLGDKLLYLHRRCLEHSAEDLLKDV